MIDPWTHVVKSIEPKIDELQLMLEQGSVIIPILTRNKNSAWQIKLESNFKMQDIFIDWDIETFDNRIEWVNKELENWDSWRSSYDTWVFSSKDEAEKFITFYILRWASQ